MVAKKQTPEDANPAAKTPEDASPVVETPEAPAVVETPEATVDVVAVPSRRADGTPDQTSGYVALVADVEDRDA